MEKIPWNSYPRPQMKRDSYCNLNGIWKMNGSDILVPYPPESKLAGFIGKMTDTMVYERRFTIPNNFTKERVLLHFGAVDQIATVWVNEKKVGTHKGGYLPFSFDITEYVVRNGDNSLKVEAVDTLSTDYPYGKQTNKPGGMWYTPVSGIWQSVWIENVPETYIEEIKLDVDLNSVQIKIKGNKEMETFKVSVADCTNENIVKEFNGCQGRVEFENPVNWTPENPHLYSMIIETDTDRVETYFALRIIEIKKFDGVNRVCLNGKPVFFHGVLDQGYFCDGIYLPENEEEYEKDILRMKELGYNMLRKHIKVEPEYFYYMCDKLGMLVMQDMVNTGKYSFVKDTALPTVGFKKKNDVVGKTTRAMDNFKLHTKDTIEKLYNHPCIVAYTIFNEGWGQFNSDYMYAYVKKLDGSRLVDSTSGWYAQQKNDFDSEHIYFKIKELQPKKRPLFVTECGGYQMLKDGHFFGRKEYGYGTCKDESVLIEKIEEMYEKMVIPGIKNGVCGCIYTQLSDVEDEINGLYTYDREVCKVDKEKMINIARELEEELW